MVLPLPVDLDELLLHAGDGSLELSGVCCQEVVVDKMGVGTEGSEEREVGLTEEGEGREGEREREEEEGKEGGQPEVQEERYEREWNEE